MRTRHVKFKKPVTIESIGFPLPAGTYLVTETDTFVQGQVAYTTVQIEIPAGIPSPSDYGATAMLLDGELEKAIQEAG